MPTCQRVNYSSTFSTAPIAPTECENFSYLAANALSAVKNMWKTVVAVSLLSRCWCFCEIEVMTKATKSEASNGVYVLKKISFVGDSTFGEEAAKAGSMILYSAQTSSTSCQYLKIKSR